MFKVTFRVQPTPTTPCQRQPPTLQPTWAARPLTLSPGAISVFSKLCLPSGSFEVHGHRLPSVKAPGAGSLLGHGRL